MRPTILTMAVSLALCSQLVAAQAQENTFQEGIMAVSYDTGAGVQQTDGTSKAESYDVALRLVDKSLVGKKIVGLRIPIINADGIDNLSGWLSSDLSLEEVDGTTVNVPSITSKSVSVTTGWVDVLFDTPYVLTEEGVFAGYSFDISKINNQNLKPIATTSEVNANGYFLRTSRTRKYKEWYQPYAENDDRGSLRLQVMVDGMEGNAASLDLYPLVNVPAAEDFTVPATLYCHGFNGIESIEYDYATGLYSGHGSLRLDSPVEASYNKFVNVDLPISPIGELGERTLDVTITKVNGFDNCDVNPSSSCKLYVFDFVPKHIPLVEEYSGTWCGNCPRGIASMEYMKEKYGNDFICLTYHNEDEMTIDLAYPSVVRGFPDCWIDRSKNTDPFFGDRLDGLFHFEEEWSAYNLAPASVALDINTEWADEDETMVTASVTLRSQKEYFDSEIAIGFVLAADDLHDDDWYQRNYYAGDDGLCPELAEMGQQPQLIYGMHFNDVVILGENVDGAQCNLPDNIKPLEEYVVEHTFNIYQAENTDGDSLVQDKGKLKVVAIAINTISGKVENCCQSDYLQTSGVDEISTSDAKIIDTRYFNLAGIQVDKPSQGIYIKQTRFSNGKTSTSKTVVK